MMRFTAVRAIESLVVLAGMSFVVYALIGLMPGDPIDIMLAGDPNMTPADRERLRELFGLHLPIYERYWNWLTAALGGDFGFSRTFNRPVLDVMAPNLGRTALLMGASFILSIAIAIPLGLAAAVRQRRLADYGINLFCFAGKSVPPFWLALMLILVFAVDLNWFPAGGIETVGNSGFVDRLRHLVLPVTCLTLLNLASVARLMRAETIAAMRQDYVRTARAKGLAEGRVIWGHALRNALNPVITVIALGRPVPAASPSTCAVTGRRGSETASTVAATAEKDAAEARAAALRTEATAQAEAEKVRAEGRAAAFSVDAAGQTALNEATNVLSPGQTAYMLKTAMLQALPAIIAAASKPMEQIDKISIVDARGLHAEAGASDGNGGSSNLADAAVAAAAPT